ncbi:MAG: CPBP family intramembrane metalloprotease [Planctomycetaceae bacterium]|nr:CPBP family intramembrane metalloprotease [Planctomycetaceae bacterium]
MSNISVLQILIISIAAGFGEEFFFRGLLQSGICESINNWTKNTTSAGAEFWAMYHVVIVLISVSILFGLAHAVTKMYFFLAFLISIYLGVILILTDNIFIPVSIHAFYDFVVLVYLRKRLQFRSLSDMF